MIGSSSKDFREVQAALGQITIQQQEVYRHDRALKAQQALIPPKEFRDKLSSPFIETSIQEIAVCASESRVSEFR
jgi:hypothetical protein